MIDEAADTQDGLLDRTVSVVRAFLRTVGVILLRPRRAARLLLDDQLAEPRRYRTPLTFLVGGSILWGFALEDFPAFEGRNEIGAWATGLIENTLEAFELDEGTFDTLAVSLVHGLGVYLIAQLFGRTVARELRADLSRLLIYLIIGVPLFMFAIMALLSLVADGESLLGMLVLVAPYPLAIVPWALLGSWLSANFSGAGRWLRVLPAGFLVPLALLALVGLEYPVDAAFDRYEASKVWVAVTDGPTWDEETQLLKVSLGGQLDATEPRELRDPLLCPPSPFEESDQSPEVQQQPDGAPAGGDPAAEIAGEDCLYGRFDRSWVPFGEEFSLTLTVGGVSPEFANFMGGWQLCIGGDDEACLSGFEWPVQLFVATLDTPPAWDAETSAWWLPVFYAFDAAAPRQLSAPWLCKPKGARNLFTRFRSEADAPIECVAAQLVPGDPMGDHPPMLTVSLPDAIDLEGWLLCAYQPETRARACLTDFEWPAR